jgi:hypothetical protein
MEISALSNNQSSTHARVASFIRMEQGLEKGKTEFYRKGGMLA